MKKNRNSSNHLIGNLTIRFVIIVFVTVFIWGCENEDDPERIIGFWKSDDIVCAEKDAMEIEYDLVGESTLHFYNDDQCYYDDFDIEVIVVESQTRYKIDFESQNSSLNDFTMDCRFRNNKMRCTGDEAFNSFDWVWEED